MKTIVSISAERLTKAQARSLARTLIKEVMAALKESSPKVWETMPLVELQNTQVTLKNAVAALLKTGDSKSANKARQAFGYMIVAEIYTPF